MNKLLETINTVNRHKWILKNPPKKRVDIPQKYIKNIVLRGVNQNPPKKCISYFCEDCKRSNDHVSEKESS